MSQFKQFINPHAHSDGSLDGASTPLEIIKKNKDLGVEYVTLTEHGNLNTAMDLYTLAKKNGIKPILGIELYIELPYDIPNLRSKQKQYAHLIVHFKDAWAYKYFLNLTKAMDKRAIVVWGERKPLCTIEELKAATGHITIGTACLIGIVGRYLLPNKNGGFSYPDLAEKSYQLIREIAGEGNFFVEIFPHELTHQWVPPVIDKKNRKIITKGFLEPLPKTEFAPDGDIQKSVNKFMISMAKKYNDPILISLDSHFANPEDKVIQDAKLGNGQDHWKYFNSYHIMTSQESAQVLQKTLNIDDSTINDWIENSYKWASNFDNFTIETSDDRWILPDLPDNWKIVLKKKIDKYGRMNWNNKDMIERLKYELEILTNNGKFNLLSYFFVIEDIANFCRRENLLINVRGSAGGSLLLYLLGVSAINPLKYNLTFERFLTLGRIKANTLPDVDIDISDKDKVLDFLKQKYKDGFAQISIDSRLKIKSSIKDAERSLYGSVSKATEKLCKILPSSPQGIDEKDFVFGKINQDGTMNLGLWQTNEKLRNWALQHKDVWIIASRMLEIQRQKSQHACGVVIASDPIQNYSPIISVNNTLLTGYSPKSIEKCGLVKYDLLGVNTLKDIELALTSIKSRYNKDLDVWHLPHQKEVFDEFIEGNTESIFQFNTPTVIPFLKKIKPQSISDLAAITALCRPGTLDAPSGDGRTLADLFVDRKNGEEIKYIHPDLEPILKETMGVQLYQEQTLEIFREIAGYTYEQAETVRRAIGKKEKKTLQSCMSDLHTACINRGWTEEQSKLLQHQIIASSNYSFNKSHAVSYAIVAYACMYLKVNYSLDWWLGCLSNAKKEELHTNFWRYVKDFTLLPDLNKSNDTFEIEQDKIRSPLSILNGVGEKTYKQLIEGKPYKDLYSFVNYHFNKDKKRRTITTSIIYKLIIAGILDTFFNKDLSSIQKIEQFEKIKAEIRQEKIKTIPEEYRDMSQLGKFLITKRLIKIYSEDLRPILLPHRNGQVDSSGDWIIKNDLTYNNYYRIISGLKFSKIRTYTEHGVANYGKVQCLGYIMDEKIITYNNKTKQATKIFVDIDGEFVEDVLWPEWGENIALSGFKDLPVLLEYQIKPDKMQLKKIIPLLDQSKKNNYNTL